MKRHPAPDRRKVKSVCHELLKIQKLKLRVPKGKAGMGLGRGGDVECQVPDMPAKSVGALGYRPDRKSVV